MKLESVIKNEEVTLFLMGEAHRTTVCLTVDIVTWVSVRGPKNVGIVWLLRLLRVHLKQWLSYQHEPSSG